MNKRILYRILYTVLAILITIDVNIGGNANKEIFSSKQLWYNNSNEVILCGVNAKTLRKGLQGGWSLLKKCSNKPARKMYSPKGFGVPLSLFSEDFAKIENESNVLPQIEEYLSKNPVDKNRIKTITCIREDAEKVRMYLQDGSFKQSKIINATDKMTRLWEYDIDSRSLKSTPQRQDWSFGG